MAMQSVHAEVAFELSLVCIFLIDYVLNFYLCEDKLRHSLSLMTLVDTLTILPIVRRKPMRTSRLARPALPATTAAAAAGVPVRGLPRRGIGGQPLLYAWLCLRE